MGRKARRRHEPDDAAPVNEGFKQKVAQNRKSEQPWESKEQGASISVLTVVSEKQFRFQDFERWKKAASLSGPLFELADELDQKKFFRLAEQLRSASVSITNNIAEGSGGASDTDFANFLNMSRRPAFEVANILMILTKDNYFPHEKTQKLLAPIRNSF